MFIINYTKRTVMLTGDAKETAVAIAQQVGLYGPQGVPIRNSAISGEEIGKFFF
jgi:magnesium-transporting ATPase (P-type)